MRTREAHNESSRKYRAAHREAIKERQRKRNHKTRENATHLAILLSGIG